MSTVLVEQAVELLVLKLPNWKAYIPSNLDDDDMTALWQAINTVSIDGKADKIIPAAVGNFASLDAEGNLTDSGKSSASFASLGHTHDGRYLRLDADNTYDSQTHTFTFTVANTEAPFVITQSGTPGVVDNLNADLLDGKHGSEYAISGHNHNSLYPQKAGIEDITGTWTFNRTAGEPPFLIGVNSFGIQVGGLNADKLDDLDSTDFALVAHTHAWGTITGTLSAQTDLQTALNAKIAKPNTSGADGEILTWDSGTEKLEHSGIDLSDLFLIADAANKVDKVPSAPIGNLASFVADGGVEDSGFAAADFAAASHNHDDRYYTETELTNYSTPLGLKESSTIESASYLLVGSNSSVGAGVTPAGTVAVRINGVTFYLITSVTA